MCRIFSLLPAVVLALLGSASPVKNSCHTWFEGDYQLTKDNYESVVSQQTYLLVSITSDRNCVVCCAYESTIGDIWMQHFVNPRSSLSKHGIKLARVNLAEESWFGSLHPNFKELPSWVIYVKGKPFYIPYFNNQQKLLTVISRIVQPIQPIGSLHSFELFMNRSIKGIDGRELLKHRVVGLFADPDDYEDEIQDIRRAALESYWREDSIFGLVINKNIAKMIWSKHFSGYKGDPKSLCNVLYSKSSGIFDDYDRLHEVKKLIVSEIADIPAYIGRQSLEHGDEYTSATRVAMDPSVHTLFAFVDLEDTKTSKEFLKSLKQITQRHQGQIQVFWADYRDNLQLMKRLGVEGLA